MFTEHDVRVVKHAGPTITSITVAAGHAIYPGEPLKVATVYAGLFATGDPVYAVDIMLGISRKEATHTSAANGTVEIITMIPMKTVLRWTATNTTKVNTQAKIDALNMDWVCCDYTDPAYTIDEDQADDPNLNGLGIIGGDPVKFTLDVIVSAFVTFAAPTPTSQP